MTNDKKIFKKKNYFTMFRTPLFRQFINRKDVQSNPIFR